METISNCGVCEGTGEVEILSDDAQELVNGVSAEYQGDLIDMYMEAGYTQIVACDAEGCHGDIILS